VFLAAASGRSNPLPAHSAVAWRALERDGYCRA